MMQASERIKNYIKSKESLQLHVYDDGTGHSAIGWGHTWHPGDKEQITEIEAEQLFDADVIIAEVGINKYVKVALLQQEFDACVSFGFNDGLKGFASSEIAHYLNQDNKIEAFSYLGRYCHSGRQPLEGLLIRRAEETLIACGKPVDKY
jgi:lysozyme